MKWINASDLERWSDSNSARNTLPKLVGDLIRASATNISYFRFPHGDKGQLPGFNGYLCAAESTFVPEGNSLWEFGTDKQIMKKANDEHNKRVRELSSEDRAKHTFVFVTPRPWVNPRKKIQDWENEKKAKNDWKNVRYIDGVALESWLEDCPAVAARYAKTELCCAPQSGARSLDDFWYEYSRYFDPPLCEEVLLCDRERQAANLLEKLLNGPDRIFLAADSSDEVIAFAIAAIQMADPAHRTFLQARALVIDTEEAARFFMGKKNLIFFLTNKMTEKVGMLADSGPTLIALGNSSLKERVEILKRPRIDNLGEAISRMGIEDTKAHNLARECGRSVTILKRRIPAGDAPKAKWSKDVANLLPAFLAGGWDSSNVLDRKIVSALAGGISYDEYETGLRQYLRDDDPPFDLAQSIWKVRAPVDAFVHVGHLIGRKYLTLLKEAALNVFSQFETPSDSDILFNLERQSEKYSNWIRDGLASTFLMIANLSEPAKLNLPHCTPQQYVDDVISSLPGLRSDYRVIASLKEQLPSLMEAAPNPLLEALEHMLEGNGEALKPIFCDKESIFFSTSPHTYVLWALETIAWDISYFRRVGMILARLSFLDPGGQTANRPISSLRNLFLSWSPCTNAPLQKRLALLDAILKNNPPIGWKLLMRLIPRGAVSFVTPPELRFRQGGSEKREELTPAIVWESQFFFIDQALNAAGDDPSKWIEIIPRISNFDRDRRDKAFDCLSKFFTTAHVNARSEVWEYLHNEYNTHKNFPGSEWTLGEDDLAIIKDLLSKYEPYDIVITKKWLFDEWEPQLPVSLENRRDKVEMMRRDAITRILLKANTQGIISLAKKVKFPHFVAQEAVNIAEDCALPDQLILKSIDEWEQMASFAASVSEAAFRKFKENWIRHLEERALQRYWKSEIIVNLIKLWPDERKTWDIAYSFGEEVSQSYWQQKPTWDISGDPNDLRYAIEQYIKANRAVDAIEGLSARAQDLSGDLIFRLLDSAALEINQSSPKLKEVFPYCLEKLFERLEGIEELSKVDIAKREYTYLPMLNYREENLTLHQLMAEDPNIYIDLICDTFREANNNERKNDISIEAQARARAGYQLLSSFKKLPGLSGENIDFEILLGWVSKVHELGEKFERLKITDQYIGQILAHAPFDPLDNAWPHQAIRNLLEILNNDQIERGIRLERFRMRGVFTKARDEGGDQERNIAKQNRMWADACSKWPRTNSMLESIASEWDHIASQEDNRAKQEQLKN